MREGGIRRVCPIVVPEVTFGRRDKSDIRLRVCHCCRDNLIAILASASQENFDRFREAYLTACFGTSMFLQGMRSTLKTSHHRLTNRNPLLLLTITKANRVTLLLSIPVNSPSSPVFKKELFRWFLSLRANGVLTSPCS